MAALDLKAIGSRLKSFREKHGLLQTVIAEEVGVTVQTISLAENGRRKPSQKLISHMAYKYHMNIDFIFTGKGSESIKIGKEDPQALSNLHAKVVGLEMELAELKDTMQGILAILNKNS